MAKCIVCGSNITEDAKNCSVCGFETEIPVFLNPEQSQKWLADVVEPAKEKWNQELEKRNKALKNVLFQYRSSGFVASGIDFYVFLNPDGTVKINGNVGIMLKRKVESAKDVKQVAVGNSHIVMLKNDGTVEAFGKNSVGQCDVKEWKDILKIAAAGDTTLAITKNSRLLSAGAGTNEINLILNTIYNSNLYIKDVSLNHNQIIIGAMSNEKVRNIINYQLFFGFYRDTFNASDLKKVTVSNNAMFICGTCGSFCISERGVQAIDDEKRSQVYASVVQSEKGKISNISAGQNIFFALADSKRVLWIGSEDRFSGTKAEKNGISYYTGFIDIPLEDEQQVLNITALSDDSVVVTVLDDVSIKTIVLR